MRPAFRATLLLALVLACSPPGVRAAGQPAGESDVPITQSIIRDGAIRFGVWVKVGERSVLAMLDTGSTGLRILPSVFHGEPRGIPTETAFGSGARMRGPAVPMPIAIGARTGVALVQVVEDLGCVASKPYCDVNRLDAEAYRIGGDGFSSEGYSAILGIGLPFRGTDIGNPLSALGVTRWIVDLPRPFAFTEGHLVLDPDARHRDGFRTLDRHGFADGDACVTAATLPKAVCGSVLFDTGAPAVSLAVPGVPALSLWPKGTPAAVRFAAGDAPLDLDVRSGETGGLLGIVVSPPEPHDPPGAFILAGVEPYFTFDVLYDSDAHRVGLKRRAAPFRIFDPEEADAAPARRQPSGGARHRRRVAERRVAPSQDAAADSGADPGP